MGNKRDGVDETYYAPHLAGVKRSFARNDQTARHAVIERMLMRTLTEMSVNRFAWKNLPPEVNVRWLELQLFRKALAVFYKDPLNDKHFAMAATQNGHVNAVGDPTAFTVYSAGGFPAAKVLSAIPRLVVADGVEEWLPAQCVPIWSNMLRVPDIDIVYVYASKLAQLDLTIEINSLQARRTKVLTVSENQLLSGTNIVRQIDEGQPTVTISSGAFTDVPVQALDLGINPDHVEKLHILRTRLWGECMGLLGINNGNQDKKERLVAAEVNQNDDQTAAMRAVNLNSRKEAAEQINALYKLNVSVDFHVDSDNPQESSIPGDDQSPKGD